MAELFNVHFSYDDDWILINHIGSILFTTVVTLPNNDVQLWLVFVFFRFNFIFHTVFYNVARTIAEPQFYKLKHSIRFTDKHTQKISSNQFKTTRNFNSIKWFHIDAENKRKAIHLMTVEWNCIESTTCRCQIQWFILVFFFRNFTQRWETKMRTTITTIHKITNNANQIIGQIEWRAVHIRNIFEYIWMRYSLFRKDEGKKYFVEYENIFKKWILSQREMEVEWSLSHLH